MFIYRIDVDGQSYIGMDSNDTYKETRWKHHKRTMIHGTSKLYVAMRNAGINKCKYSFIEEGFDSITQLALAEMAYIKKFNTKQNGLNSTYGGDGLGKHLHVLHEVDIINIKTALSQRMTEYNYNQKWVGLDDSARKRLTQHLHNDKVYQSKSEALTAYWDNVGDDKRNHQLRGLKTQWNNLTEKEKLQRTDRGNLFSPKTYQIEWNTGMIEIITNLASFCRKHNIVPSHVRYYLDKDKFFKGMFKVSNV